MVKNNKNQEKSKKLYVKPCVEVIPCAQTLLDSLSMKVGNEAASGGGDAKRGMTGEFNTEVWEPVNKDNIWDK